MENLQREITVSFPSEEGDFERENFKCVLRFQKRIIERFAAMDYERVGGSSGGPAFEIFFQPKVQK